MDCSPVHKVIRLLIGVVAGLDSSPERETSVCKVWLLLCCTFLGAAGQLAVLFTHFHHGVRVEWSQLWRPLHYLPDYSSIYMGC